MVEYTKVNVKLANTQLKKLKDAVKNNTGTTLGISSKMFNGNNLPHELLLSIIICQLIYNFLNLKLIK